MSNNLYYRKKVGTHFEWMCVVKGSAEHQALLKRANPPKFVTARQRSQGKMAVNECNGAGASVGEIPLGVQVTAAKAGLKISPAAGMYATPAPTPTSQVRTRPSIVAAGYKFNSGFGPPPDKGSLEVRSKEEYNRRVKYVHQGSPIYAMSQQSDINPATRRDWVYPQDGMAAAVMWAYDHGKIPTRYVYPQTKEEQCISWLPNVLVFQYQDETRWRYILWLDIYFDPFKMEMYEKYEAQR